jgi:23S rRNA pseudouridine1911/1915/1917 synthase
LRPSTDSITLVVDAAGHEQRLDKWASSQLPEWTRSKIQRLIESEEILLNGRASRVSAKLKEGDIINVHVSPPEAPILNPRELPLNIIFEDESIIVINKPAGLVVHPGAGDTGVTLVEGLLYYLGRLAANGNHEGWLRPGIVHRLDKDTTGVMVCAKTDEALAKLSAQFAAKTNDREYVALVNGVMRSREIVRESYLYRDPHSRLRFVSMELDDYLERFGALGAGPGRYRYAKSLFTRQGIFASRLSLVSVRLFTGRTHQIRVHSKDIGLHVVGDPLYGHEAALPAHFDKDLRARVSGLTRQMLHARLLGIDHPVTGARLVFEAELPSDYSMLLQELAPYRTDPQE